MFHKKKFNLVEKKSDKVMYSAHRKKWIKYFIILGLFCFVLLIILANVRSKSYYQSLKVTRNPFEFQSSTTLPSVFFSNDISPRAIGCSRNGCSVTCTGDMSDLKKYLNDQKSCTSMTLAISSYTFPNEQLDSNWLTGSFNLTVIRLSKGILKGIVNGAFDHKTVKYVETLELSDVQIPTLTPYTFNGLSSLKDFILTNTVDSFEGSGFLKPVQNTLKQIKFKIPTKNAVDPTPWLLGDFKELYAITFDGCNFESNIRNDTFQHLTQLTFLRIVSSKVSALPDGIFNFMMTQIAVYIDLEKNELKQITGNFLKKVSSLKRLELSYNLWHCSCELNDLITEYKKYPDGFGSNVICSSPPDYAGQSIGDLDVFSCDDTTVSTVSTTSSTTISVSTPSVTTPTSSTTTEEFPTTYPNVPDSSPNLSDTTTVSTSPSETESSEKETSSTETSSITPSSTEDSEDTTFDSSSSSSEDEITATLPQTTPSPQNRTTTLGANTIFIECQRYKSTTVYLELAPPLASFTITYLSSTSVKLTVDESIEDLALIWFYDQPHLNGSGKDIRIIGEFRVGCQSDVENSLTIEGLSARRAYTFCLVLEGQEVISPFSCLSYCTGYSAMSDMSACDTWLNSQDKPLTIGLFVFGILVSLGLGSLTTYCIIRAHPVLLKGSKRVVIVNRCTGDVLIMPKPSEKQPLSENSLRNSYETNTTIPQRRFSDTSIQSGLSYMLANNYEDIEYRWKMNCVNEMIYANRIPKSPPPPLPKRSSEAASKDYYNKIDISVIHKKGNDYGYIS